MNLQVISWWGFSLTPHPNTNHCCRPSYMIVSQFSRLTENTSHHSDYQGKYSHLGQPLCSIFLINPLSSSHHSSPSIASPHNSLSTTSSSGSFATKGNSQHLPADMPCTHAVETNLHSNCMWFCCWALRFGVNGHILISIEDLEQVLIWWESWAILNWENLKEHIFLDEKSIILYMTIYVILIHLYILNHLECFTISWVNHSSPNQTSQLHPRHSNRQAFPIRASAASCAMRLEPNALVARERCSGAAQSTKAAQCMMMSLELHNLWSRYASRGL